MRCIILLVISLISTVCLRAQTVENLDISFEKARKEFDQAKKEFADSADAALASYLEYEAQFFEEYQQFRQEIMRTWGDSVVVESTRKEWVEYSDDHLSRTSVDWESGKVSVEVLVDPGADSAEVKKQLQKAITDLLSNKGNTDRPLLEGQLDLSSYGVGSFSVPEAPKPFAANSKPRPAPTRGEKLNLARNGSSTNVNQSGQTMVGFAAEQRALEEQRKAEEAAAAALLAEQKAKEEEAFAKVPEAIVESKTPVVQTVQTDEGEKNVIRITMELVENHIPKRAEKFKDMISKHASVYTVDEPLVYAIMEQESAFNPQAQSWVPAYGLMQLVPKSGGRDAYRFVHKTDAIPSADFLFNPDNNIQLGTGYLKLLMSTTFKKVEDPRCRMLCAIAAYNTGAGNVSRAINGTTNISKAIPSINKMSYDQLFNHLKASLPHDETKDYIQKVTSKMQKYIK
jgi:soluble lytic murein transglycosylase-like protein